VSTTGRDAVEPEDDFYDAAPLEPHLLYQGEILVDVPLLAAPKDKRWLLLRTKSGARLDEALKTSTVRLAKVLDSNQTELEWKATPEGDFAMAVISKRPVMVLNQNCDIQNKDFIQVAPIFDAIGTPEELDRLKKGELFSAFYLKARPPLFPESLVDFELIQAVHKTYIKQIEPGKHLRLKEARVRELQRRITRYFGRPNAYDVATDTAPATGTYLCVPCFYRDGAITAQDRVTGDAFDKCPVCAGERWVLKGR
jgi:hypothetical protein